MKKENERISDSRSVSVAIATYNGEKYITDQLDSILKQLSSTDEIVISDDGSSDSTIDIIRRYQKEYSIIKLIKGPQKGVIKNFENAIRHCNNQIIFLADQDDIWLDNKVNEVVDVFLKKKKVNVVLHNMSFFNENGIVVEKFIDYHPGFLMNILKSSYWGCCMAFRKNFCKKFLSIPKIVPAHDQWIGIVGEKNKCSFFLNKNLIKHRIHESNVSQKTSLIRKIVFREKLLLSYISFKGMDD